VPLAGGNVGRGVGRMLDGKPVEYESMPEPYSKPKGGRKVNITDNISIKPASSDMPQSGEGRGEGASRGSRAGNAPPCAS